MNGRLSIALVALAVSAAASAPGPGEKPLVNLLGSGLSAIAPGPGVEVQRSQDGAGLAAKLRPGAAEGVVDLGPFPLPAATGLLRFTARLGMSLTGSCSLFAGFAVGGRESRMSGVPFSQYGARLGPVFQDLAIPVPAGANSARLRFVLTAGADGGAPELVIRHPFACAAPHPAVQESGDGNLVLRHGFCHPDGRADLCRGGSLLPLWSCMLPTARGKDGPGLLLRSASDAMLFSLPKQQVLERGHVTFCLKPGWEQRDGRPADMVRISQGSPAKLLIRKNHRWSFLFVCWDAKGKTRSAHCALKELHKDRWTKVLAAWDANRGLRLVLNGVTLGKKDCTWAAPPASRVGVRVGQGKHDKGSRAPYVLDGIEVRTDVPRGVFE